MGSHYHFIETNKELRFDRARAYGKRLHILAGTAVRFEPGDTKTVTLVDIAGNKVVRGGNGKRDVSNSDACKRLIFLAALGRKRTLRSGRCCDNKSEQLLSSLHWRSGATALAGTPR